MAEDPVHPEGVFALEFLERLRKRGPGTDRYRTEGEVARGGQGLVLRVWDEDLRRELAMKVLIDEGEAVREGTFASGTRSFGRFLEEAQVTGQLDHPGIVPVHELGLDGEGRLFFTMKFVKGRTLQEIYALVAERKEGWTRTRALTVLLKVCEAMAYAHHKGVVHRDLKPANVMVGRFGEVLVMDWGLARVLSHVDTRDVRIAPKPPTLKLSTDRPRLGGGSLDSPLVTMDGDVVGTPAYMAPEQALGRLERIGPHTDVYAVGAMLYHLLAGHMPHAEPGVKLDNHAFWNLVQRGPPVPLGQRARDAPAELIAIAEKAMARKIEERYRDMGELAADLQAFLENRVVSAHRTGAFVELRKWMERNKPLAAAVAAGVLALAGGLVASLVLKARADGNARLAHQNATLAEENEARARNEAARAQESSELAETQRKEADQSRALAEERLEFARVEQKKAQQSAAFLESLFGGIDPYVAAGADTSLLRRILGEARTRITSELAAQPEAEAAIRQTLGDAYTNLGAYDEAEPELLRAQELYHGLFGAEDRRTLLVQGSLAELRFMRGDHAGAEALWRETLAAREQALGPDARETLSAKIALGDVQGRMGRAAEAEVTLRQAFERAQALFGAEDKDTLHAAFALAIVLHQQNEDEEAEELLGDVLFRRRESLGDDAPSTIETLGNLALVVAARGRLAEAEQLEREVLERLRRVLGAENPQTLNVLNNLAVVLADQGKTAEAEATARECLEIRRRVLGARHPDTLRSLSLLADQLIDQGRLPEAVPLLEEALAAQREALGEGHADTLASKYRLAVVLKAEHRNAQAAELLGEIASRDRERLGEHNPDLGVALYNWAGTLQDLGDQAGAERLFREVLDLREKHDWKAEPFLAAAVNGLAKALEAQGRRAEADELFEEALAMRRELFGPGEVVHSLFDYGEALLERGDLDSAEPLLQELCAVVPRVSRPGEWRIQSAECLLGHCLALQGRFAEAEAHLLPACDKLVNDPGAKPEVVALGLDWIVKLYEAWDVAEPGRGHAEKAGPWRRLRAASHLDE